MAAVIPAEAAATAGQEVCLKTPTSLLIAPTNLNRKHKESHRKSLSSSLPRRPFDSTTLHPLLPRPPSSCALYFTFIYYLCSCSIQSSQPFSIFSSISSPSSSFTNSSKFFPFVLFFHEEPVPPRDTRSMYSVYIYISIYIYMSSIVYLFNCA